MGDLPFPDHLLLFCFFFVLFLLPQTQPTLLREHYICQDDQKTSLLQLQQESFSNTLWKQETDCCSWESVTCNITTGYVIGLDLSSKLSRPIYSNSSLFGLHHLQRLNLAYNQFEQTPFPSGFDRLPRLTHLNFSETCFSGQVPWEFSRLTRLVSLDLSSWLCYETTAKLERPNLKELIQNLTSLTELYLDRVDLSAQGRDWSQVLPQFLPNLCALSLVSCGLSGPIHSSFSQLVFLEELLLSENYILSFETPKFLAANFSHLKTLSLSSCRLHGEFPNDFFHLPNLQVLHVKDNSLLNGQFPDFLHNNAFQDISLSNTNFSGAIPDSIGNLTHLTFLDLTMNHFIGSIPSSLANLTHLAYLDLSYNNFTGSVPPFNKDNVPNLEHLDLSNNLLDGTIHSSLFALPSLQMLQLSYNQLEGRLELSHNLSSSSLVTIDLVGNKLNGEIPKSFSEFSSLWALRVSSNNFSGTVKLDMFGNLENLLDLDLSNNLLSVEVGNNSSSFHFQLVSLRLGSCHIKEFPEFLRTQEYLQYLDLSNNQIQGHVPSWIWKEDLLEVDLSYNGIVDLEPPFTDHSNPSTLKSLYSLTLISCNLRAIPEFLKDLNELMFLDLSNNNISGKLPNWIWKESLSELNLSYNSLYAFEQPLLKFSSCPLSSLDLRWNKLQGSIPIPSSTVRFFSISNNSFVGGIPESICKLSSLLLFDASHNNLSGSIPECLGNIRSLSVLDVHENRFHGMPQNFANASSLKTLNINGNILEGQVPRSLTNCTSLEVLDLGKNKLSDTFPFWLGKLPR
ncbi:receptor-like protein 6 [Macadamia integrifolia]|uniref:receptor-like protein 6 n=1 Tax=Macadamia integrifolia TaxID=60698 RepID=UPI001C52E051|nr:receptor-like protein 6 [Macadamia integrifolia]